MGQHSSSSKKSRSSSSKHSVKADSGSSQHHSSSRRSGSSEHLEALIESEEIEEVNDVDAVEEDAVEVNEDEAVVPGADCMWDGTGEDVDELSMNQICALYTESECISSMNGKSKGRCTWKGKMHSKTSKFHTNLDDNREEMVNGFSVTKVMSMQFSTFDVLLGTAFFATLAFAVYQVYRWCAIKAKANEYTPLQDF